MKRPRIGTLLCQMGKLSEHEVDEILEEQASSRQRFGQIALTWGMCEPQHVWQAWAMQAAETGEPVNLETIGVDAQAAARLSREMATRYQAIAIRMCADCLVIATSGLRSSREIEELSQAVGTRVQLVAAPAAQVQQAIRRYCQHAA
jgi:hypothetical protein